MKHPPEFCRYPVCKKRILISEVKRVSTCDLIKLLFKAEYRYDNYKLIDEKDLERLSVVDGKI
jgi:hypothetical protein